jgi:hypothetical protein
MPNTKFNVFNGIGFVYGIQLSIKRREDQFRLQNMEDGSPDWPFSPKGSATFAGVVYRFLLTVCRSYALTTLDCSPIIQRSRLTLALAKPPFFFPL